MRGTDQWLRLQIGVLGLALMRGWVTADDADAEDLMAQMERLLTEGAPAKSPQAEQARALDPLPGYALWAATYDRPGNPIVDVEQPLVHGLLRDVPPGRALDAACGTGRHAAFLIERGHSVVALDGSPDMLAVARRRAPSASTLTANLTALPLNAGAFDLAVCALALTHVRDLTAAVVELGRVVRPGGRIVISDLHPQLVSLGAHAGFEAANGTRHFVINLVHRHATYLRAFEVGALRLRACYEPGLADATLGLSPALQRVPDAAQWALAEIPALLVWDLERDGG